MSDDSRAQLAYETFNANHRSIRKGPPWALLPSYAQDTWLKVARALDTVAPIGVVIADGGPSVRDCFCADCRKNRAA
jgi:hypothetical protein